MAGSKLVFILMTFDIGILLYDGYDIWTHNDIATHRRQNYETLNSTTIGTKTALLNAVDLGIVFLPTPSRTRF